MLKLKRIVVMLMLVCVVAGLSAGCATGGSDLVYDYCAYGAVSEAQLDGCVEHVTPEVVDGYDTNAAEYARGELDSCLDDAGPFCEDR